MNTNKLIKFIIPQKVKVRKYEVDIESIQSLLRSSKNKAKLSNRDIAEKLNKSITLVEHWFRKDKCFSIPDASIWEQLKNILNIQTDEFYNGITIFEERDGTYEKGNRVYDIDGICSTLTAEGSELERFIVFNNKLKT